jgi:cephalosporin hydroxylase
MIDTIRHAPVRAAQIRDELRELVALYCDLAPVNVVEIGTWTGGTLYQWLINAAKGTRVMSIDQGPENWVPPDPTFNNSVWWDWVPDGALLYALMGDSHDPEMVKKVQAITGGGIDWLFIDGDHTYQGVKADWDLWSPHINKGGVVAFHDLKSPDWAPHIQVGKLWQELKLNGHLTQEFIHPDYDWGGIGVVYF